MVDYVSAILVLIFLVGKAVESDYFTVRMEESKEAKLLIRVANKFKRDVSAAVETYRYGRVQAFRGNETGTCG
jgi:hypothetical protein